ncbi:hypothetical protein BJ987_007225 [Nocardia goodfellowii]|uniref:Uncharacterized protein n=1 Tax=Nocardia goodfellowii TaxID=882446 RepID=A0ABS4QRI7_9NOCA|nr:hypothetical protein [Nocardia goodfellowii]
MILRPVLNLVTTVLNVVGELLSAVTGGLL